MRELSTIECRSIAGGWDLGSPNVTGNVLSMLFNSTGLIQTLRVIGDFQRPGPPPGLPGLPPGIGAGAASPSNLNGGSEA